MELSLFDDDRLLGGLEELARREREDTAAVVEHLAEISRRRLVEKRGYPSLFEYCVRKLGYSASSAYHRIRAARAVEKRPELLDHLRRGELHLRALVLLHPHLDEPDADELIRRALGKSEREVEAIVGPVLCSSSMRESIRIVKLRHTSVGSLPLFENVAEPVRAPAVESKVQISFIADESIIDLLDRARAILWHKFPDGRLESVFTAALGDLLEKREPRADSDGRHGRSRGRGVPRWIRRQVWKRDGGRCVFKAQDGRLCGSRQSLEFDHVVPWAFGGSSNDLGNIRLLCRIHNQLAADDAGLSRPRRL